MNISKSSKGKNVLSIKKKETSIIKSTLSISQSGRCHPLLQIAKAKLVSFKKPILVFLNILEQLPVPLTFLFIPPKSEIIFVTEYAEILSP